MPELLLEERERVTPDAYATWASTARATLIRKAQRAYRIPAEWAADFVDDRIASNLKIAHTLASPGDANRVTMWGVRGDVLNAQQTRRVAADYAAHAGHYVDPTPSPLALVEAADRRDRVQHAVLTLNPAYRELAWRVLALGEPIKDVATAMGMPYSTAKWRVERARGDLRAALEDGEDTR